MNVDLTMAEPEYWFHVSPQDNLPIAGTIEVGLDLLRVSRFFQATALAPVATTRKVVASLLIAEPSLFSDVRQFLGISDKRAYLDLSYIASRTEHPQNATSLCGCQPWTLSRHPLAFFVRMLAGGSGDMVQQMAGLMMADYLLKHGLQQSAPGFAAMTPDVLEILYARLISPKEYQQRAAKRRGHGCEAALARVLIAAGLTIVPNDKAANPMGSRDPNVDLLTMKVVDRSVGQTHSFDMIISHNRNTRVLIQSLIHTSDPGQYGVNKSDETVSIKAKIDEWNSANPQHRVELWALLDGVGFSENKPQTINKILSSLDTFVQINTLYKALLKAHDLKLITVRAIRFGTCYTDDQVRRLSDLYVDKSIQILKPDSDGKLTWSGIEAGLAMVYIDKLAHPLQPVDLRLSSMA